MNKYENEQFRVDEFSKVEEYQHFKAEDFKGLELLSVKNEEYKVEEIQKQSFVNDETTNKPQPNKKDNKAFEKIRNKILSSSSSSTSASVSTALGSTGALLTAGVIGAGVVLSPVIDLPIFPIVSEEPSEESTINYGSISLVNYSVDVIETSEKVSYKVTIKFDEQIDEQYQCYIVNKQTQESKLLDTSIDEVIFENLVDNKYIFDLLIKDSEDNILHIESINISMVGSIVYTNNHSYDWLITYNDDDTYNVYYHPKYDYSNNKIQLDAKLVDSSGSLIASNNKVVDNVFYFEDISVRDFTLLTSGYLIENENKYMIHNETIAYESPTLFDYNLTANEEKVSVEIDGNISEDINVTLTYLDDNSVENYTYSNKTWTGDVDITLTKKTEKVKVDIQANSFNPTSTNYDFVTYKGSINKSYIISEELFTNVASTINLESVEILTESFANNNGIPTVLSFDGYMIKDAYYKVNVYDASSNLVAQSDNLTTLNVPVILYDLPTDQTLTFTYLIYNKDNDQLFTDTYQTSLEVPTQYLDVEEYVYINYENPGAVTRSFNEDGTINYYLYTAFENSSSYDVKARVSLYDGDELTNSITKYTQEQVTVFENVPNDKRYGISYYIAVQDGIKSYVIDNSRMVPSGVLNDDRMDDGIYNINLDVYETESFKQYEVELRTSFNSDLNVEVILDSGETVEFTLLQSEIIDNKFILDLSNYDFVEATVNVTGLFDISNSTDDILQEVTSLKGNIYHDTLASSNIYLSVGYVYYTHHNVESKCVIDENSGEKIIYKDIYIYLTSYMNDFFDCKVVNTNDNSYVLFDESLEYVVITDLLAGEYNFELQIIDSNGKVYETTPLTINTETNIEYTTNPAHDKLVTYNEDDGTYNFYYYPKFDYDNNLIESIYTLKDQDGNVIETATRENLGIAFERLEHTTIMLEYKAYLKDQDNTYLIATSSTDLFELDKIPYVINRISEDEVTVSFDNKLESDLVIEIIYKDDNTKETFEVTQDQWTGSVTLTLSKLSEEIEISVTSTLVIFDQNVDGNINYYMGKLSKVYECSETLSYNIDVQASLESVDILNNTYSYYGTTPTVLKFKGYKKADQTLTVNVYDSTNTLVSSVSEIDNVNKYVTFEDLIVNELLTFEYIIYDADKTTQLYRNTYQTTLEKPSEYTSDGISYKSFNPNDITLTFNEDGTCNAYLIINLENTSTYDTYLRLELEDSFDGSNTRVAYGNGSVMVIERIDPTVSYTLSYGLVIKDGVNYYSITDRTVPSGTLFPSSYVNGAFDLYAPAEEISTSMYEVALANEITSDVNVTVILDETTTETFAISHDEIIDNVLVIDLSQYQYSNAEITLEGKAIIQYNTEIESAVDNINGVKEWKFIATFTI